MGTSTRPTSLVGIPFAKWWKLIRSFPFHFAEPASIGIFPFHSGVSIVPVQQETLLPHHHEMCNRNSERNASHFLDQRSEFSFVIGLIGRLRLGNPLVVLRLNVYIFFAEMSFAALSKRQILEKEQIVNMLILGSSETGGRGKIFIRYWSTLGSLYSTLFRRILSTGFLPMLHISSIHN